eukprot:1157512-Pelagomonas_calceolata.AAC.14
MRVRGKHVGALQNFNKSREALNSTEEKLKAATVELQKTGMDLVAKRSECQASIEIWVALGAELQWVQGAVCVRQDDAGSPAG